MNKILPPDKLTPEVNNTCVEKYYKYWKKTFENFIEDCGRDAPDKLRCLTKYTSADVFDASIYDEATSSLNQLYLRPKNEIFPRHQLAMTSQKSNESLDEFIQNLQLLAKHIELKDVTGMQYREKLIRDSFINGFQSSRIW